MLNYISFKSNNAFEKYGEDIGFDNLDLCSIEKIGDGEYAATIVSDCICFENLNSSDLEDEITNQLNEGFVRMGFNADCKDVIVIYAGIYFSYCR